MKAAEDVMTSPVLTMPHSTVVELARALEESGMDGACVMEHGRLVGVATLMDLIRSENAHKVRVVELMSVNPITVLPGATLKHCADQMFRKHLTILPVVDGDHALLGVVTKDTLLGVAGLGHHVLK